MKSDSGTKQERMTRGCCWGGFLLILSTALPVAALAQTTGDLTGSSLEELMNVEVTSVSKKEQSLAKTPAAVFVISQEDIRRSGATNIPDLLRMAPGVEVAQIDANQWAISIRGFNSVYANKVLVLIDGRAIYVNTFSGVYWDELDVPLENIDRVEVIRGPGGTVWGANAMNGVINIITKGAADTKGGLVAGGGGSGVTAEGLVQYGGNLGSTGAFRVFGKYADINNSLFFGGLRAADGWHKWHGGFRADWKPSDRDTVSVQGDIQTAAAGETTSAVLTIGGLRQTALNLRLNDTSGDVLVRWDRALERGSVSLQAYESSTRRDEDGTHISADTIDIEFEHHLSAGTGHDVVWGGDYRVTRDRLGSFGEYSVQFAPPHFTSSLFSVFAQDEIRLKRSLALTLGSKFEHNVYTGFVVEPGTQLMFTPNERNSLWISGAKAIRQPARSDHSIIYNFGLQPLPGGATALIRLEGNPHTRAEELTDYEVGYRSQLSRKLSLDITGFLSFYHHLQTTELRAPALSFAGGIPQVVIPLQFDNLSGARSGGVEILGTWKAGRQWKLSSGYSALRMRVTTDPSSTDLTTYLNPGDSPRQQIQFRSLLSLRKNVEWDSSLKYVGGLSGLNVPGYARLDSRIAWHPTESLEISVTGQNLSTGGHIEFMDRSNLFVATQISRSVFAKFTWRL